MPEISQKTLDDIYLHIANLQRRIEGLESNPTPTFPVYDSSNWPQDPVEGQVVIAPSAGGGGVSDLWVYKDGAWQEAGSGNPLIATDGSTIIDPTRTLTIGTGLELIDGGSGNAIVEATTPTGTFPPFTGFTGVIKDGLFATNAGPPGGAIMQLTTYESHNINVSNSESTGHIFFTEAGFYQCNFTLQIRAWDTIDPTKTAQMQFIIEAQSINYEKYIDTATLGEDGMVFMSFCQHFSVGDDLRCLGVKWGGPADFGAFSTGVFVPLFSCVKVTEAPL